jgi:CBS domain-containing protein
MSIAAEIRRSRVGHLELHEYVTAEEELPVSDVVALMAGGNRSTALITNGGRLTGIFTERDVLHRVASAPSAWHRPVREVMTPEPVTIDAGATIHVALAKMKEGHFRDLPVVDEEGSIVGNLTDNAVVRRLADYLQAEVLNLPPDPDQVPQSVEGA